MKKIIVLKIFLARLLAQLPNMHASVSPQTNWVQLLKEQARITAVAPVEALNALGQMLPDKASRERALALAAAVMMIEPTLANPRSEIIELLIAALGVDPQRVMGLARKLTAAVGDGGEAAHGWAAHGPLGRATPPPVKVIDTVGAGDTFQAALISQLVSDPEGAIRALDGLDSDRLARILDYAARAAAITCSIDSATRTSSMRPG